jgi:zinc D-Ala-D-Ala carboxypeptidase
MTWKHFKIDEFRCKCGCGQSLVKPELVDALDKARSLAGVPFKIISGYRCGTHNALVGGKPRSAHLSGLAADIACRASGPRYNIIISLMSSGFSRIGVHKNFIHADLASNLPTPSIWLY